MLAFVMTPNADIQVIINPASAAWKTQNRIPAIAGALERRFPHRCAFTVTREPGDAAGVAARAVRSAASLIVAVGGDGTVNEIVHGVIEAAREGFPACPLGLISSGSGCGLALSLRLPPALDEQVRAIAECSPRQVDAGVVSFGEPGRSGERDRYFINECQIGIGADVVTRTRGGRKSAGGLIGYGLGTLSALFLSPNIDVRLSIDGGEESSVSVLGIAIGNGDVTAGGMSLTPGAEPDDGALNLLTIGALSRFSRLRSFPKIYAGTHVGARGFSYRAIQTCMVSGSRPLPVSADGEVIGTLPCTITILKRAIEFRAPHRPLITAAGERDARHAEARI